LGPSKQENIKKKPVKGNMSSSSIIKINDDQVNRGDNFVMETPEKIELQRKIVDDLKEVDEHEPPFRRTKLESQEEVDSSSTRESRKYFLETSIISITQIVFSSDPDYKGKLSR